MLVTACDLHNILTRERLHERGQSLDLSVAMAELAVAAEAVRVDLAAVGEDEGVAEATYHLAHVLVAQHLNKLRAPLRESVAVAEAAVVAATPRVEPALFGRALGGGRGGGRAHRACTRTHRRRNILLGVPLPHLVGDGESARHEACIETATRQLGRGVAVGRVRAVSLIRHHRQHRHFSATQLAEASAGLNWQSRFWRFCPK